MNANPRLNHRSIGLKNAVSRVFAVAVIASWWSFLPIVDAQELDLDRPATTVAAATKEIKLADGLAVSIFASEPTVAN
jgi:hypothetical protein